MNLKKIKLTLEKHIMSLYFLLVEYRIIFTHLKEYSKTRNPLLVFGTKKHRREWCPYLQPRENKYPSKTLRVDMWLGGKKEQAAAVPSWQSSRFLYPSELFPSISSLEEK